MYNLNLLVEKNLNLGIIYGLIYCQFWLGLYMYFFYLCINNNRLQINKGCDIYGCICFNVYMDLEVISCI